ncbi:MAG: methyl-accepting chemotaxis protein [Sulfuricella sp.]|nr:methyl-accepting chemotaxis protein [Sulfuricella sp.]
MLNNLKIKTRLYVLIGFVSLLLVWVGVTGLSGINATTSALGSVYNDRLIAIEQLNEVRNYQLQTRLALFAARQESDAFDVLGHTDRIRGYIFKIENILKAYGERRMAAEEKALLDVFVRDRVNFGRTGVMPMIDLLQGEKFAEADQLRKDVMDPAYVKASAGIDALLKYQEDHARREFDQSAAYAGKVHIITIASILGGLILSVLAGFFITRCIARGVSTLEQAAGQLSAGDLTARVEVCSNDELGQVAHAFNKMASEFGDLIGQVQQAARQITDATGQLSDSAERVAQGSTSQTSEAASAAASVENLNQAIQEVASRSQAATRAAGDTDALATQGQQVVNGAAQGIREIADTFNESARLIDALGQRSQQIGQIVNVIKDIADQTNLLALNAAIEAARAGEQGRGFAVVADEVRKLAERTATATAEISTMINAIQSETGNTVNNMDKGSKQVDQGVQLAAQAGESLQQINTSLRHVAEMIRHIAEATRQQSEASNEITRRVDGIVRMAEENSATISTTTGATQDLRVLSGELQSVISRFRLAG